MIKLLYPKFWQYNSWKSKILFPLTYLYGFFSKFNKIFTRTIKLPSLVICVGNVTVGGTGKTQFVIWLANLFKAHNITYVIACKSYNANLQYCCFVDNDSNVKIVGDEAKELSLFGEVLATRKWKYLIPILKQLKAQIVILDDGLQSEVFYKNFSILMIDGNRKFGNNKILPAGPLRSSVKEAVAKSDIAVVINNKKDNLLELSIPMFSATIIPTYNLNSNENYYAFTGIGNPEQFFELLKKNNFKLSGIKVFPDHYYYKNKDICWLRNEAQKLKASLITTRKDYMRLQNKLKTEIFHVELEIDFPDKLANAIYEKVKCTLHS